MAYDMYQEIILQHYRAPRNFGPLEGADLAGEESNPMCGDKILIQLKLNSARSKVDEIRFSGEGCAISVASASLLTQSIAGHPLEEVTRMQQEDVLALLGIPLSPVRVKCALTAFTALGRALQSGGLAPDGPAGSGGTGAK
ncbi:MAG: iron-sulfur cluster assembly scaffold protein [Thermoplasmata archaeon]|nr:iron-sulfur cluster assembly scaffold protein [Thermoplasmata archaeon]